VSYGRSETGNNRSYVSMYAIGGFDFKTYSRKTAFCCCTYGSDLQSMYLVLRVPCIDRERPCGCVDSHQMLLSSEGAVLRITWIIRFARSEYCCSVQGRPPAGHCPMLTMMRVQFCVLVSSNSLPHLTWMYRLPPPNRIRSRKYVSILQRNRGAIHVTFVVQVTKLHLAVVVGNAQTFKGTEHFLTC
jgi:hypothetical protein